MITIATLAVKLMADAVEYSQTLRKAQQSAQETATSISKSLKSTGGDMTTAGKNMTVGVTLPVLAAGVAAVKYASDLEETKSKTNVVFGSMAGDVMAWSKNSADAIGMSQQKALDAVSTFGAMGSAAGMTGAETVKWSEDLVQLGADWSSFYNLNPADALAKIQSATAGQYEPLRSMGIQVNQAAVEQKALQMGLIETSVDMTKVQGLMLDAEQAQSAYNATVKKYGDDSLQARQAAQTMAEVQDKLAAAQAGEVGTLSEAARYQALYALMVEQSAAAQGDREKTAGAAAGQMRTLQASYEDAAAALGGQLLPHVTQLMGWITQGITWFQQLSPETQKWVLIVAGAAAAIGPILVMVGGLITAVGTIAGVIGAISTPVLVVIGVVAALIAVGYALYLAWQSNWMNIQGVVAWAVKYITTIIKAWQAAFNGDWHQFGYLLGTAWRMAWDAIVSGVSGMGAKIGVAMSNIVKSASAAIKNFSWSGLGKSILDGIVSGLVNNVQSIIDAAQAVGEAAMGAFEGFFEIQSPSKKMERRIAKNIALGAFNLTPYVNAGLFEPALASVPALAQNAVGKAFAGSGSKQGIYLNNYGSIVMPNENTNQREGLLRQLS